MMIGIDPGPAVSGWVVLNDDGELLQAGVRGNEAILHDLQVMNYRANPVLAIEWISSFGMPVGAEVFATCRWVGRFQQAWHDPADVLLIPRAAVKLQLCNSARANDSTIRQALIDLYQPTGGGACPQIGTTKKRGPLYGISSHAWPALAVAIVASGRLAAAQGSAPAAFMGPTPLERV